MPGPSRLDDPLYAERAWSRYWRLMRWMAMLTLACVIVTLGVLFYLHGLVSIHMYVAAAGGVFLAMMLTSALMGLVFISSSSGHDDSIDDPTSKDVLNNE